MFLRTLFGMLLAMSLISVAAPSLAAEVSGPKDLHHLTLRVLHHANPVFSPRVSVQEGRTAILTLEEKHGRRYTLVLDVAQALAFVGEAAADLQWSLWEGEQFSGTLLQEGALTISPIMVQAAARSGRPLGLHKQEPDAGPTDVQVLDYSMETAALEPDGVLKACAIATTAASVRNSGCCGAKCQDGSGQSLKCCGASSCCACGTCCHVP